MSILTYFFKPTKKLDFETVEFRVSVEECKHLVRIITVDKQIVGPQDFFKRSKKLRFSRFYLIGEELTKPHFAPSMKEAVIWFTGKNFPGDGYSHAYWGTKTKLECQTCVDVIQIPFLIKKIESLTIFREIPRYQEIVGWRVSEVESELMGKGIPDRLFTIDGGYSIIRWESPKQNLLCKRCSR